MTPTQSDWGLVVFVAVAVVNVVGLALDLLLVSFGCRTVTEWVWEYPPAGLPILAWQAAGLAGLGWHFYGRG